MPTGVKAGTFARSTATTGFPFTLQHITGLNFQPKALIVTAIGSNSSPTTIQRPSIGFAGAIGQNVSIGWGADNKTTTISSVNATNTFRRARNDYVLCGGSASTATPPFMKVASYDWNGSTGGVTFTYDNNDSSTYDVYYMAIGGTDITNVKAGSFNLNTTTGNQSVTDVGFVPDIVFFMGANTPAPTAVGSSADHMSWFFGAAKDANNEAVMAHSSVDAKIDAVDSGRYQVTNRCIAFFTPGAAITSGSLASLDAEAEYVGTTTAGTGGFTINVINAPTTSNPVFYLAIKGGSWNVSSLTQPTTGTTPFTQAYTTPTAHTPRGILAFGHGSNASTNVVNSQHYTFGAADSATSEWSTFGRDDDANTINNSYRGRSTTQLMRTAQGNSAAVVISSEADVASFNTNSGFTLNWTLIDATARQLLYVTAGDNLGSLHQVTPPTDTVDITETVANRRDVRFSVPEPVGITESVYVGKTVQHTVATEPVGIRETVTAQRGIGHSVAESVGITESVSVLINTQMLVPTDVDTVGITESVYATVANSRLISPADLLYKFSGGTSNSDPNLSLGGPKSEVVDSGTTTPGDFHPDDFAPNSDWYGAEWVPGGNSTVYKRLFDDVTFAETSGSVTVYNYRCFYAVNNNTAKSMNDVRIWIEQNTPGPDHIRIGVGAVGVNTAESAIADEYTAPSGVTFLEPSNFDTGIKLGNLPPNGGYRAVWIERRVPPKVGEYIGNKYRLRSAFYSDHD